MGVVWWFGISYVMVFCCFVVIEVELGVKLFEWICVGYVLMLVGEDVVVVVEWI